MIHEAYHYGDAEHAHYEEHGYCIFDHFLTDGVVEECRRQLDRMIGQLHPELPSDQMISTHQRGATWVWDLATYPRLLDMIERQVGPNIVLFSTHLLCKAPHTGESVPWHQDSPYWNVSGNLSGGVWIPLDDIDEENGAMSVLPGWHKKGTLRRLYDDERFFSEEIDPAVLPDDIDRIKVRYDLAAGQMAVHHTMIPHNSVPNRSDRWRRVLIIRYLGADAEMGEKEYEDYRTREPFAREFYLIRGDDVQNLGLKRSPDPAAVVDGT